MKRVLVTGATGFIGRQCVPQLAAQGFEVHAVTSGTPDGRDEQAIWHRTDLLDMRQLQAVTAGTQASHLLHLGWHVGDYNDFGTHAKWMDASLELLKRFRQYGGHRAVIAGSGFEYDWTSGLCDERRTPTNPVTNYGRCKRATHLLIEGCLDGSELACAWARVFFLYGPHEPPRRLVASVIRSLLLGEPALTSHGEQVRDYLHVHDAARALVALICSDVDGPINVASGEPIALKKIVRRIARAMDREDLLRLGAIPAPHDQSRVVANTTRIVDELGWRPSYSLDAGLAQTIRWWRTQLEVNEPVQ